MTTKELTECDVSSDVFTGQNPEGMSEVVAKIPGHGARISGLDFHVKDEVMVDAGVPESAMEGCMPVVLFSGTYSEKSEPSVGEPIGVMFNNSRGSRFDPYVIEKGAHHNIQCMCNEVEKRLMEKGYDITR